MSRFSSCNDIVLNKLNYHSSSMLLC